MPVDITRLFNSEFHAQSDDPAWRAGITLWLKSWHQVPAASLPDDDVALTRLAELGRDVRSWKALKSFALRKWTKCSDGRLYHPVVAEKALEAWISKITQRKASEAGNAKRYGLRFDPKPFDLAIDDTCSRLRSLNPQSRSVKRRPQKTPVDAPGGSAIAASENPNGIH